MLKNDTLVAKIGVDVAENEPSKVGPPSEFSRRPLDLAERRRPGAGVERLRAVVLEERRRLKIIPNAWGEKPVLKLMFAAMTRAAERWRAIKVTDFERRQMAAISEELDQEYEAQTGLAKKPSKERAGGKLSSNSRT